MDAQKKKEEFTITLTSKDESLMVSSLLRVVRETVQLLRDIDGCNEDGRESPPWRIQKCSMSSPLVFVLDRETAGNRSIERFLNAFRVMDKSEVRPEGLFDSALERCKKIVSVLNDGVAKISFSSPGQKSVSPTQRVAATVDAVLHRAKHSYEVEDMQIEGRLGAIVVYGCTEFIVFDVLTDEKVECYFSPEDLDDVKSMLGRRVRAIGLAKCNKEHRILSLVVDSFRSLREQSELPQLADLHQAGVSVTGGKSINKYLGEIRDAN